MSHNLHLFKVNAKNTEDAVKKVAYFLEEQLENPAEEGEDTYAGYDYFVVGGALCVPSGIVEWHPYNEFSFNGTISDSRSYNWMVRYKTPESLSENVLEGHLTPEQVLDSTSEYLPHEYWECGCTVFNTSADAPLTHIVYVDFHN